MTRQYYYKVNDCKAGCARDAACICWHDEGTGPLFDDVVANSDHLGLSGPTEWRDKPEEWTAALLPDDALDPNSYVGRKLNANPEYPPDTTVASEPLPLWWAMMFAGHNEPGTPRDAIAAEIEALRGWLPHRPPKAFYEQLCRELGNYDVTMAGRTMDWVFDLLTEQARIARGEP